MMLAAASMSVRSAAQRIRSGAVAVNHACGAWNTLIEEAAGDGRPKRSAERGAKRRLDFAPLAGSP